MTISAEIFNILRSAVKVKEGVYLRHFSAWLDEIEKDVDFSDTKAPVFKKPVRIRSYRQSSFHEWMHESVEKDCENQAELLKSKTNVQAQHQTSTLANSMHAIRDARVKRWLDDIHQEHDSHQATPSQLRPGSPEPNFIPANLDSDVDDSEGGLLLDHGIAIVLNPPTEPEIKKSESSSVDITEKFELEADSRNESQNLKSFTTAFSEPRKFASVIALTDGLLNSADESKAEVDQLSDMEQAILDHGVDWYER
jgi:hypothetical protein